MEVGERGLTVNNDDPRVPTDVAEGFIVWARDYVAAVAAHESEFRRRRLAVPGLCLAGSGGGLDRVRVERRRWGGSGDRRSSGEWWVLHRRSLRWRERERKREMGKRLLCWLDLGGLFILLAHPNPMLFPNLFIVIVLINTTN